MKPDVYEALAALEFDHWWNRSLRDLIGKLVLRYGTRPSHEKATDEGWTATLEIGCGTGGNIALWEELFGGEIIATDISPLALYHASRRNFRTRLVRADTNFLPFRQERFSAVMLIGVLHHLWIECPNAVMKVVGTLLSPGGVVIVSDPSFEILRRNIDGRVMAARRFRARDIEAMGRAAGLEPLYIGYFTAFAFLPALILAVKDRLFGNRNDDGPTVDLAMPPRRLNELLYRIAALENRAILAGFRFPFGVEVIGVFRKPKAPSP